MKVGRTDRREVVREGEPGGEVGEGAVSSEGRITYRQTLIKAGGERGPARASGEDEEEQDRWRGGGEEKAGGGHEGLSNRPPAP